MKKLPRLLAMAIAALAACTGNRSDGAGSASSTPTSGGVTASGPGPRAASPSSIGGSCPRTGRWALCSVEKRLEQSGFVVRRVNGAASRRAGFSVTPTVYTLGRSRLEVFIYPTESALEADVANLDTVSVVPRGAPSHWSIAPTFVRSANLVAVFVTDNSTQAERLMLALTAGAPQP